MPPFYNRKEFRLHTFPGLNLGAVDVALPPNTPVRLENLEPDPPGALSTIPGRSIHANLGIEHPTLALETYMDGNGVEGLFAVVGRRLFKIDPTTGSETLLYSWT